MLSTNEKCILAYAAFSGTPKHKVVLETESGEGHFLARVYSADNDPVYETGDSPDKATENLTDTLIDLMDLNIRSLEYAKAEIVAGKQPTGNTVIDKIFRAGNAAFARGWLRLSIEQAENGLWVSWLQDLDGVYYAEMTAPTAAGVLSDLLTEVKKCLLSKTEQARKELASLESILSE